MTSTLAIVIGTKVVTTFNVATHVEDGTTIYTLDPEAAEALRFNLDLVIESQRPVSQERYPGRLLRTVSA